MLERRVITAPGAPAPGGAYSSAVCIDGWVFVSGQGPIDPETGSVIGSGIEEQTDRTLENIAALLSEAGCTLSDVILSTVHLSDVDLFDRFDAAYERHFTGSKPARITVGSALVGGICVEIAVIARAH